jgi:hypothetical protein
LFGDRLAPLDTKRGHYVERSPGGPAAYCDLFRRTFGPVVALYATLEDRPEVAKELDRDFLDFATRANRAPAGDRAEYPYEYLLVVGRKVASRG